MQHASFDDTIHDARNAARNLRDRNGLNDHSLARQLSGVGYRAVQRFISGETRRPNARVFEALASLDSRLATHDELRAFRQARDFDKHHGLV